MEEARARGEANVSKKSDWWSATSSLRDREGKEK